MNMKVKKSRGIPAEIPRWDISDLEFHLSPITGKESFIQLWTVMPDFLLKPPLQKQKAEKTAAVVLSDDYCLRLTQQIKHRNNANHTELHAFVLKKTQQTTNTPHCCQDNVSARGEETVFLQQQLQTTWANQQVKGTSGTENFYWGPTSRVCCAGISEDGCCLHRFVHSPLIPWYQSFSSCISPPQDNLYLLLANSRYPLLQYL